MLGWLSAGKDAFSKNLTKLKQVNNNPAMYDLVVIGTPIWDHTLSAPIRTYCTQFKDHFKKVAFFCTYQYTEDDIFKELTLLCNQPPIATLRLHRKKEIKTNQYLQKVEEFTNKLITYEQVH